MPFDDPNDREVARKVLEVIRSDKYKAKNYLFLAPFDMSQVPGYLELVGQPIDLATIANKLLSDVYTKETFWHDMDLVFQNAIKYHGGKETKWIAKFAKDMLKNVARERNNLEKGKPTKPVKVKQELKKKIKVKMGTGSSNKSDDKTVKKAKPTQSKPQPKLKLKLSLKKKEEPSPPAVPSAPKSTKIKISTGGSRGKELPQGVVAPPAPKSTAKPPPKPKAATTKKSTSSVGSTKSSTTKTKKKSLLTKKLPKANTKLDAAQTKLCYKVIAGLKRRNHKNISWFNSPVSDKAILADYRSKIKQPMDLQTITSKLDKGSYKNLESFCLDLRRVFANAMKYNTTIKDSLRPLALQILQSAEKLLQMFIYRLYPESYPPLLYCWKVCVDILSTLYNLVNPSDGQPLAYYFLHPVAVYCGGQFPVDYKEKVSKPMDFGTVTANLLEGRYQSVEAFSSDCRLVIQNCQTYYNGRPEGKVFVDQALRLNDVLSTQLLQLARYDKSKGASGRKKLQDEMLPSNILSRVVLPNQPPTALLLAILQEMRALQYTDKATKITEPAMVPFEKPVNLTVFPDYPQFVREPMDLQTVERKVRQNSIYEMPEDFEYDMNLIWKNSEVYNLRRNDLHSVNMAKYASRQFRRIFYARMQSFEDPTVAAPPPPQRDTSSPPTKKIKIDTSGTSKGKMGPGPKISITASQVMAASRAKSPVQKKAGAPPRPKANQPVPLHIAIARVKEAFPLRRTVKTLQSWEADCARYFKELMRHPWITGQKFIFHVPVPTLFPELRDIYAAKIKQPMDLTTVECQMLAGNRYAGPEDFIQDVALVFENAIKFNKDSKDLGDPLSCAYYDASVHLLRYSRWLSLELLSSHVDNTSDHTDEYRANGLPPSTWKLTGGNRRVARKETEDIIRKEPIEKSIEGDRYTWMEAECEKLLKALRLQSDVRYMTFFIQANYPADYTAFISKPMDWEKVNRTYVVFGHVFCCISPL